MATLAAPKAAVPTPSSPVPLDTIPISPGGDNAGDSDTEGAKREYKDGEEITVFHDPDNFNVKHPLMNTWTLWFTKPPSGKVEYEQSDCDILLIVLEGDNWNDLLKEVVTFDSVEEFWGVYVSATSSTCTLADGGQNNISPTSQLAVKSDYHLFKTGVRPEWEDPQNKHGGKWSYQFKDKRSVPIDELWLYVMLAAIGETLENQGDGEVMGVVVNVRKGFYRIGVWTKTVGKSIPGGGDGDVAGGKGRSADRSKTVLLGIGARFKEVLKIEGNEAVEFNSHTESAHAGSTRAKAKFTV